jgi:hypothetical protein
VGAIGDCHIQVTFLYAFEGKLLETLLLSTAAFKIGCCSSASQFGAIDIAGLIHERYGRRRISSSVRRLISKTPAPPQVATRCEISAET